MKLCPLCGHQNKDEDKYCAYCGTKLEDVAPQAKPQPVVETQPTVETQPAKADSNPWVAADTFAIIGFAAAIAGVGALGIPSLIFSILGLKSKRLHGMAVAGLVLSIIGMVFFTIYVIILLSIGAANIFPYLSSF